MKNDHILIFTVWIGYL